MWLLCSAGPCRILLESLLQAATVALFLETLERLIAKQFASLDGASQVASTVSLTSALPSPVALVSRSTSGTEGGFAGY